MAKKSVRRKISSQVRSAQGGGQTSIHRYRGYESPSRQSGSELSNLQKITRTAKAATSPASKRFGTVAGVADFVPFGAPFGAAVKSVVKEVKRRRRK